MLADQIIFGNFGASFPGDSPIDYQAAAGFFGSAFTATNGGVLNQVEFDIGGGPLSTTTAALYTNSGGEPGTELESWSVPVPVDTPATIPEPLTILTSVIHPVLSSGAQYWFVFTQDPNNTVNIQGNDQGLDGGFFSNASLTQLGTGQVLASDPTLGLELVSTPEPSAGALVGIGGLLLAGIRRTFRPSK
jgi:hypothetical protein